MKCVKFLKSNLIAHRGLHNNNIPENTIRSFISAINKNYIIELDIHILKSGEIVVYHDYNLYRLTKINKVIETITLDELNKIKINNKYNIPTLDKTLKIINAKVPIIIEVKDLTNNIVFLDKLIKILDNYNGEFAIHSFNPFVIDYLYKNKKDYVIGLIIQNKVNLKLVSEYIDKVDFLSINKKLLPIKNKKTILGWTIINKEELEKHKDKCDNLICEKIL